MATATQTLPSSSSTPGFSQFTPEPIAWQDRALDDVLCQYDYSKGVHEVLLSGAVGSAKSMFMAHIGVWICLNYPNATGCIARETLGDLRDTIYKRIKEHLDNDPKLIAGRHYHCVDSTCNIRFANGSRIIARTWHDGDYESVRSLDLTFALIEESTQLDDDRGKKYYQELKMRVGRTAHIPFALVLQATNPGDPEHWLYPYFHLDLDENPETRFEANVSERPETKHVYYSVTSDNQFLPPWYVESIARDLSPDEADRMLRGRWRPINRTVIYSQYNKAINFVNDDYEINPSYPIRISWDFNIAEGKPLSAIIFQYWEHDDSFHWAREVVVEGMRTQDSCDEIADTGILNVPGLHFVIHGDAAGKHKDTRNNKSDYDIIRKFFSQYTYKHEGKEHHLSFEVKVPLSNPPVRERHNRMNAYFCNDLGEVRSYVYKNAPTLDKGLRLTKLKTGSKFQEDDSKPWQHITTAAGYGLVACRSALVVKKQGTVQL